MQLTTANIVHIQTLEERMGKNLFGPTLGSKAFRAVAHKPSYQEGVRTVFGMEEKKKRKKVKKKKRKKVKKKKRKKEKKKKRKENSLLNQILGFIGELNVIWELQMFLFGGKLCFLAPQKRQESNRIEQKRKRKKRRKKKKDSLALYPMILPYIASTDSS